MRTLRTRSDRGPRSSKRQPISAHATSVFSRELGSALLHAAAESFVWFLLLLVALEIMQMDNPPVNLLHHRCVLRLTD